MNELMSLETVHLDQHTQDLRRLYDKVEANIRGLDALGVKPEAYGALFTPILVKKLPAELRLNLARRVSSSEWNLTKIMEMLKEELEARERAVFAPISRGKTAPTHKGRASHSG
uniref:Uncharacterized protein n=1 Tax=Amphimedon queenslandica TaxID=400682 RepID=A0A1X7TA53_AMPQE